MKALLLILVVLITIAVADVKQERRPNEVVSRITDMRAQLFKLRGETQYHHRPEHPRPQHPRPHHSGHPSDPSHPAGPSNPENPNNNPENPENPTNPEGPSNPENPNNNPENPNNPSVPSDPENPNNNPENPNNNPENPNNPSGPSDPENPNNPSGPSDPENPNNPSSEDPSDSYSSSDSFPDTPSSESESSSFESSSSSEGKACPMWTIECPDGTWATLNEDCGFMCGGPPVGGLSYEQVVLIKRSFVAAYSAVIMGVEIDTLVGKDIIVRPPEKLNDSCLDVGIATRNNNMPVVYNGVRVFYYEIACAPLKCADGSIVGCGEICPSSSDTEMVDDSSAVLVPIAAILFVITLSTCCCYLRKRKCSASNGACNSAAYKPLEVPQEVYYPAEQYEIIQQEQPEFTDMQAVPIMIPPYMMPQMMPAHMMPPPMFPPHMMPQMMPMMHPQMAGQVPPMPPVMMMPNGAYPVMMQSPNGLWFPVPAPEDA